MNIKIPTEEYDNIAKLYEDHTETSIAKIYNVHAKTIGEIIKKLKIGKGHRIYSVDETYFEKIDSLEKAYIFGLYCSDGNVERKFSSLKISLVESDKSAIEYIAKSLKCKSKIKIVYREKPRKNSALLAICSHKICEDLNRLGCVPAKSLIIKFPKLSNNDITWAFIMGYFDGNGSICCKKNSMSGFKMSITSSIDFCNGLKEFLDDNDIKSSISYYKKSLHNADIRLHSSDAIKFGFNIYKNAPFFLERKKKKLIEIINYRKNSNRANDDKQYYEIS